LNQLDEVIVVRTVLLGTYVPVDFIAAGMLHGLQFIEPAAILAISYGRVIVRDFANLAATQLVQPGIPNMTDSHLTLFNDGDRQNTSHPFPLVTRLGQAKNFVVGHRDRFTNAIGKAAGLSFEPGSHPVQSYFRRLFAGCLTTNAIDHQKNASLDIEVKTIFVVGPQKARMSFTGTSECSRYTHTASFTFKTYDECLRTQRTRQKQSNTKERKFAPSAVIS
jgi:hypothetical protein